MAYHQSLQFVRQQMELLKSQTAERLDAMQRQLDEMQARLDKWETPAQDPRGKGRDGRTRKDGTGRRRPTPIPDRPAVMKAADVGVDPR